jgi:transcriptional regulator GlxA family with amidase domain
MNLGYTDRFEKEGGDLHGRYAWFSMKRYAIYICTYTVQSSLAIVLDSLQLANRRAQHRLFHLTLIGEKPGPFGTNGLQFAPAAGLELLNEMDGIIIPAVSGELDAILADCAGLLKVLPGLAKRRQMISICSGAFLLAASGVLNARRATTHWALQREFTMQFPQVKLEFDEMVVRDELCLTSGGGMTGIDLCLNMIEAEGGIALARQVAASLMYDYGRGPQSTYFPLVPANSRQDEMVSKAQNHLQEKYRENIKVIEVATWLNTTPRTLLRRFKQELGLSPQQYLQRIRLEAARHHLVSSSLSLDQIIEETGYHDRAAFIRLFKRHFRTTPAAYRTKAKANAREG